jgi:hypothetical protein
VKAVHAWRSAEDSSLGFFNSALIEFAMGTPVSDATLAKQGFVLVSGNDERWAPSAFAINPEPHTASKKGRSHNLILT